VLSPAAHAARGRSGLNQARGQGVILSLGSFEGTVLRVLLSAIETTPPLVVGAAGLFCIRTVLHPPRRARLPRPDHPDRAAQHSLGL